MSDDIKIPMAEVDSLLQSLVGSVDRFQDLTGAHRGDAVPAAFRDIGGPLTGSIMQSILMGGLGYGAGRLVAPVYPEVLEEPKDFAKRTALYGAMLPWLAHTPDMYRNVRAGGWPAINNPREKTAAMDYSVVADKAHQWYTEPKYFGRSSIPVGHMSDLVSRSGAARPYVDTVNTTLEEASGGKPRGLVSPKDIVRAGMRLGVGYLVGKPAMMVLGKTLGAVAGLNRPAQEKLTRYGTLGIMIGNTLRGVGR